MKKLSLKNLKVVKISDSEKSIIKGGSGISMRTESSCCGGGCGGSTWPECGSTN